jgi:[glutamine synthetase] adenylyltransferase / [glutamine synthetase]-adenylyl-L-tyrosine phosphorylase
LPDYLERLRQDAPAALERIRASPAAWRYLTATFAYSRFLSEAVVRQPEWVLELAEAPDMQRALTTQEFASRLLQFHNGEPDAPLMLARFRRRQILRIMLRDVLGLAELPEIAEELSNLADAILDFAYRQIRSRLAARHGDPGGGFAVIALGKLGGQELNYSSDIDLMFVYGPGNQHPSPVTPHPNPLTHKEFFKKLANELTAMLSTYTADGLCYRVDLRLRPDGRLGEICLSLEGARQYYQQRARDWEKQMLIKARACAGDRELGRELLDFVEPLIYSSSLNFRAVEAVSEARERISEKLAARRGNSHGLDVKLTPGGIRDIEFLVQCLQRLHGGRQRWVRHGGTLLALSRLHDKNLLSAGEFGRLVSAYRFLRHLEHRLQFDEDRQTHTLPSSPEELAALARKMPPQSGEPLTAESLEAALHQHLANVRELYGQVVRASKPDHAGAALQGSRVAEVLARSRVRRGRQRFEHFLEILSAQAPGLERLHRDPGLMPRLVDVFEHSQYFGDQLLRYPELLEEWNSPGAPPALPIGDIASLRTEFRKRMFAIQTDSLLRPAPVFETLERTSELADAVIAAAYRIATGDSPANDMLVIALGRLGMREFDLASDADLVFVVPDAESARQVFWTGVAERMINTISAYTGEGVMFTVDTRLRPNGREGALVQSAGAVKDYFARRAEAWEGIAYMKSRAVAGNVEAGTSFLHELQEVDWRRYGQSGRSRKELAQMRARLEKEQGARSPLKAGAGGYYDIDFALMYLRLKGAGIFYKVLNTPARIDVIEQMGHLEREDAGFLRDAAVFYRAIDHGLRISTGHAEGRLPTSAAQSNMLSELVARWIPEHLRKGPLDVRLTEIRRTTREFFERVFGSAG